MNMERAREWEMGYTTTTLHHYYHHVFIFQLFFLLPSCCSLTLTHIRNDLFNFCVSIEMVIGIDSQRGIG
jgi:hypothetical protein